jgi:glycerophosphoryl diester phosphodiesterase
MSLLTTLPRPIIFGHRGASAHAPENTIAAFKLALEQGADAVELDAKLTADGAVIVIHDLTLDRTTNGSGPVSAHSLADFRKLEAGSFFDPRFKGEPVPTLAEVFEAVGEETFINVELTNYENAADGLPDRVAEVVRRHGLEERVMFSSFLPSSLRRIHKLLPACPIGLLTSKQYDSLLKLAGQTRLNRYQALHPAMSDVTRARVRHAHSRGRLVNVYTVNESEDMKRLFAIGVDGIFTDDPALGRQTLAAWRNSQKEI